MLYRTYERLMVQALLDPAFGAALLADPRKAALGEGYSPMLAESLVGLHAATLNEFAVSLHRRIYGRSTDSSSISVQPKCAAPNPIIPFRRSVQG